MVLLRLMMKQDLDQVVKIERQSFPNPYPREYFQMLARSSPDLFVVATDDTIDSNHLSIILGYATAQILQLEQQRIGHLISIAVKPAMRRKGIGTQLIKNLINRLRDKKCVQVRLEVAITNQAALSMYMKNGFSQKGVIPEYYIGGEDAALLFLDLEDTT